MRASRCAKTMRSIGSSVPTRGATATPSARIAASCAFSDTITAFSAVEVSSNCLASAVSAPNNPQTRGGKSACGEHEGGGHFEQLQSTPTSPGTVQRHLHARPDPGNLTKGRLDASHRLQELPVRLPEFLANGTGLCMLCEGLCIHLAQVVPIVFRALDPGAPEGPVVARPWPGGYGL